MLYRLIRGRLDAIQHRYPRRCQLGNTGFVQDRPNTRHLTGRHLALSEVIDRQHGVGLAAAERRLQLDNRIPALAGQPLDHRIQQQAHALSDKSALEEQLRILILRCRRTGVYARDIRSELSLNKGAAAHVFMGFGDQTPGFQSHSLLPRLPGQSQALLPHARPLRRK